MPDEDIIKMNTDINLTDNSGEPIQVNTPRPEYIIETFNMHQNGTDSSTIITGDDE